MNLDLGKKQNAMLDQPNSNWSVKCKAQEEIFSCAYFVSGILAAEVELVTIVRV
jgi:hypothetical protein